MLKMIKLITLQVLNSEEAQAEEEVDYFSQHIYQAPPPPPPATPEPKSQSPPPPATIISTPHHQISTSPPVAVVVEPIPVQSTQVVDEESNTNNFETTQISAMIKLTALSKELLLSGTGGEGEGFDQTDASKNEEKAKTSDETEIIENEGKQSYPLENDDLKGA
jgi:hypothetical protein